MNRSILSGLISLAILAVSIAIACSSPAAAQTTAPQAWNAPYMKSVAMSVGTPVPANFGTAPFAVPVRAILISCTSPGNIVLQLADGSTVTLNALPAGIYVLPMQVVEVVSSTATATFSALG